MNEDIEEYRKIGEGLINQLKLTTYPIAVKLIKSGQEVLSNTLRPKDMFDFEIPACLAYTWCRRGGFHFFLKGEDIACKPISCHHFGLEQLQDPEDLYKAWERKAAYKKTAEMEKKSRENDATLDFGEIQGIVLSPLNSTIIKPDIVMIYCSPLILSHLILAATYEGDSITSHFNGMESSCKEGIIRTYKTNRCQVVSPGMGDRVMAGVQDHEMIFSIPRLKLEMVLNNLFLAGKKINPPPFGIPHLNATLGSVKTFGKWNEPGVWPLLRKKKRNDKNGS
jgi:uncharacterized protein (DUF169 family)